MKNKIALTMFALSLLTLTSTAHAEFTPQTAPAGVTQQAPIQQQYNQGMNNNLIDLNRASEVDLQQLSGIGPKLAQRITAYRNTHNGFTSVEQLLDVSGIGPKRMESIRSQVKV